MRDDASVKAAVAEAGHVDILVNNAGFEVWGPVEEMTVDDIKDQFETNVYGPFRMITAIVPRCATAAKASSSTSPPSRASPERPSTASTLPPSGHSRPSAKPSISSSATLASVPTSSSPAASRRPSATTVVSSAQLPAKESPYTQLVAEWEKVAERLNPGGSASKPEDVAAVILDAIEVGDKLRYPVGQDANMIVTARKAMSFEQFETAMRAQLQLNW